MKKTFQDKVAIVTGSSRGIGKAIAIELAKNGAKVVINGRNKERLNDVEQQLKLFSTHVAVFQGDVSDEKQAEALVQFTISTFKRLDILINNVGVSMRGAFVDLNPSVFKQVFESNVYGSVFPSIPALKHLRKTKGSLVFISSLAGIRGLPDLSAYCSSKMSLRAIAESIRIEEKQHHIHVGLIQVGITQIEHYKETIAADGSMKTLKMRTETGAQTTQQVAIATLKNIQKRKFLTTLTGIGKLNNWMQARFPMLVEKIILKNLHKFKAKND